MSAPATTALSAESIASITASLTALDELQSKIMSAAQADDAINGDDGAEKLYTFASEMRGKFMDPDDMDPEQQMPPEVTDLLTNEVIPGLADLAAELQQLWDSVKATIESGEASEQQVVESLELSSTDEGATKRVNDALDKLEKISLDAVDEGLKEMGDQLGDLIGGLGAAFGEVFGSSR